MSTDVPTAQQQHASARFGWVFALVAAGVAMANVDLFVVNVAVPNIASKLDGAALSNVSWVLNGYAVVFAALLVPLGSISDRIGPRAAYLTGIAVFTTASLLCAVAPNLWVLIAARVVQAAGAALLIPSSLGLLLATASPEQRPSAIRNWAALSGLAAAIGPAIGGALTEIDWRWIFLINIPIGVAVVIFGVRAITYRGRGKTTAAVDLLGSGLLVVGIGALALALVKGSDWHWASAPTGATFGIALLALVLSVVRSLRHPSPALPIALFRLPGMAVALVANALFSVAFGAMLLAIPLWCQHVWHWSALQTGLAMAPGPLMVPLLTRIAGAFVQRFRAGMASTSGSLLFAIGICWWMVTLDDRPNYLLALLPGLLLTGVGVCFAMPTLIGHALRGVPPDRFSTGSAVITMVRQAGMVLGVAGLVAVLGSWGGAASFMSGWRFILAIALACAIACLPIAIRAKSESTRQ